MIIVMGGMTVAKNVDLIMSGKLDTVTICIERKLEKP